MNTIKNTLNNLSSTYDSISNNLSKYTNKVSDTVTSIKNTVLSETDYSPILGYKTGEQGWYDQIGGGPCNKYCRYTGLNPNVQWTCSDSKQLYRLNPTSKAKTGIFCYPYDSKSKTPEKNGVVINGNYISIKPENELSDYNFITYQNTTGDSIENFSLQTSNSQPIKNMTLTECENLCRNDNSCKGLTFNTKNSTCTISENPIQPKEFSPYTVIANKKIHKPLNGMYSIYQNSSCINSSLFDPNPTVKKSLGLNFSRGIPQIPNKMTCPSNQDNRFIFGSNYEIIGFNNNDNSVENIYCLQSNKDSTISKAPCTYGKNQFWTYDKDLHTIRNWNGECLNIETDGNKVIPTVKSCTNNANQQFILKSAEKELQPNNSIYLEGFDVNIKIENNYIYLIYLTILLIFLVLSIVKK